jgi:UDP-N-acetylmuramoyl-L-alanyl-D-glutamate--2,6-diaminopimelate ligase
MRVDALWEVVTAAPGSEGARLAGTGDGSVEVTEVHHDSRQVTSGTLFCCVPGGAADGHDYAGEAVAAGAVALLCERPLDLEVPQLIVPSTRALMGPLAAEVYGHPSRSLQVVGVTGTNGKTTTVHLLRTLFETAGRPTEVIGTLTGARTTPEAPDLQRTFAAFRDAGTQVVAMEVSSHALAQHRVTGTWFTAAVFTNLSRDHLDFHHDMSAYFQAKARLFEPELAALGVVNLDDPQGRLLLDARHIPTVGFSLDDADELALGTDGSTFQWRGQRIFLPLVGDFNVSNALAAATAAEALGVEPAVVAQGLASVGPVPGRFEVLDEGQPFLVVVDFAHTPDGLTHALGSARLLATGGRVILVFGAGGDRDRSKRPEMGEAATRGADVVIITSDNPRGEDPMAIIEAVRSGVVTGSDTLEVSVEPDRRAAIDLAVAQARRGDVVLIAGKGHETSQTIGPRVLPFDDREVARAALRHRENVE